MKFRVEGAILAVVVVALIAPTVQADEEEPLQPPEGLEAEYDPESGTLTLLWESSATGSQGYRVYRDGEPVHDTTDTVYTETLGHEEGSFYHVYWVTMTHEESGGESLTSDPIVAMDGPICEPVIIGIEPDVFPYVHGGVNHACVEGLIRMIKKLIDGDDGSSFNPQKLISGSPIEGDWKELNQFA